MSNIPLSVKYRPHRLSEVIGQRVVVQTLTNAFKSKNLHHAYIFGGQFGSGKTSVFRILAAMENCLKNKEGEPCGECDNCKTIFSGKSQDIIETNAAKERGIDEMRSLHERIKFAPLKCRVRYVCFDEAHSLTTAAAESALKMIEEPPPNVRFVLCTTDAHKLKPTIHSRCEFLKFGKVGWLDINNHLLQVSKSEDVSLDEAASKLAARYARGSVRNALQNLQAITDYAGSGKQITKDIAVEALGLIDQNVYFVIVDSILKKRPSDAILAVNRLLSEGKQADQVVEGLASHLRYLMLSKACGDSLPELDLTGEEIKKYELQTNQTPLSLLMEMISYLTNIHRGLIVNMDQQLLLERFIMDSLIFVVKLSKKQGK